MLGRRVISAQATSALAAALLLHARPRSSAASEFRAVAVVAGGFLIPSEQYLSYAAGLEALGCCTLTFADPSTLSLPVLPSEAARAALDAVEAQARGLGVAPDAPLFLLGHSRGAKTCVAAASLSRHRVAGMVLLDPVDATSKDPSSVLDTLGRLRVPTAVLGSRYGESDGCAPRGANHEAFARSIDPATERLVGVLGKAGHTQFVDQRRSLLVDVCSRGADKDEQVRELALTTTTAWFEHTLKAHAASDDGSIRALRQRSFGATIEWVA